MSEQDRQPPQDDRARRREARRIIGEYHEQQQRLLLERIRDGFTRMDAGEIDPFELDELIHHYHRSSQKLWSFCQTTGSQALRAVGMLELAREDGDEYHWWEAGDPRRER